MGPPCHATEGGLLVVPYVARNISAYRPDDSVLESDWESKCTPGRPYMPKGSLGLFLCMFYVKLLLHQSQHYGYLTTHAGLFKYV